MPKVQPKGLLEQHFGIKPKVEQKPSVWQQAKEKASQLKAKIFNKKPEPSFGEKAKAKAVAAKDAVVNVAVAGKNAVVKKFSKEEQKPLTRTEKVKTYIKTQIKNIRMTFRSYRLSISNKNYRDLMTALEVGDLKALFNKDGKLKDGTSVKNIKKEATRVDLILKELESNVSSSVAHAVRIAYAANGKNDINRAIKAVIGNHQVRALKNVQKLTHGFHFTTKANADDISSSVNNVKNNVPEALKYLAGAIAENQHQNKLAKQDAEVEEKFTVGKPFTWFANKLINGKDFVFNGGHATDLDFAYDLINKISARQISNKEIVTEMRNHIAVPA